MKKEFDHRLDLQLQEYTSSGSPDEGRMAGIRGIWKFRPGLRPASSGLQPLLKSTVSDEAGRLECMSEPVTRIH